jgi:hypothetical protein
MLRLIFPITGKNTGKTQENSSAGALDERLVQYSQRFSIVSRILEQGIKFRITGKDPKITGKKQGTAVRLFETQ